MLNKKTDGGSPSARSWPSGRRPRARRRNLHPAHLERLPAPVLAGREARRRAGRARRTTSRSPSKVLRPKRWSTSRSTCSRPRSPRSPPRSASPRSTRKAAIPLLKKAQAAKIPVIAFDRGVDSDIPRTTCTTDNLAAAGLAADKMAELIGNSGEVALVVHDQTSRTGIDRRDGFVNEMKAKHPNVKIVDIQYGARRPAEVDRNRQVDPAGSPEPKGNVRRQ